jgi:hypothetical protein
LLDKDGARQFVNHGSDIWCLICIELWFQEYMDQAPVHKEPSTSTFFIKQ